jgi:hypothetical protein
VAAEEVQLFDAGKGNQTPHPRTIELPDQRLRLTFCCSTLFSNSLAGIQLSISKLQSFLSRFCYRGLCPIEAAPLDPLLPIPPWRGRESRTRIRYAHAQFSSPLCTIEARVPSERDGCARASYPCAVAVGCVVKCVGDHVRRCHCRAIHGRGGQCDASKRCYNTVGIDVEGVGDMYRCCFPGDPLVFLFCSFTFSLSSSPRQTSQHHVNILHVQAPNITKLTPCPL